MEMTPKNIIIIEEYDGGLYSVKVGEQKAKICRSFTDVVSEIKTGLGVETKPRGKKEEQGRAA